MRLNFAFVALASLAIAFASGEQVRADQDETKSEAHKTITSTVIPEAKGTQRFMRKVKVLTRTPASEPTKTADPANSINNVQVSPQIRVDLKAPSQSNPQVHTNRPLDIKSDNHKVTQVPYRPRMSKPKEQPKEDAKPEEEPKVDVIEKEIPEMSEEKPESEDETPTASVETPSPAPGQTEVPIITQQVPTSDAIPVEQVRQLLLNQQQEHQQEMMRLLMDSAKKLSQENVVRNSAANVVSRVNNEQLQAIDSSGNRRAQRMSGVGNVDETIIENAGNVKKTVVRDSGNHEEQVQPDQSVKNETPKETSEPKVDDQKPKRKVIIRRPFERLFDYDHLLKLQAVDEIVYEAEPEFRVPPRERSPPAVDQKPVIIIDRAPVQAQPNVIQTAPVTTPVPVPVPFAGYGSPYNHFNMYNPRAEFSHWSGPNMSTAPGMQFAPSWMMPMTWPMSGGFAMPIPYPVPVPAGPKKETEIEEPKQEKEPKQEEEPKVIELEVEKEKEKPKEPEIQYIEHKRLVPIDDDEDDKVKTDMPKIVDPVKNNIVVETVQQAAKKVPSSLFNMISKPMELVARPTETVTIKEEPKKEQKFKTIIERIPVQVNQQQEPQQTQS